MSRWQRRARLGLGVFAVGFAVTVWFLMEERRAPAPVQPVQRLDPAAASEIRGGDVLQHKGAKRDIRIEFDSQIVYTDGRTRFTAFKAFVDDRGGRSFVITGDEAYLGAQLNTYDVRGNVVIKTSDGLTAKTTEATFTEAEGILRGPGPLEFQRARVTGSGVGFTYDRSVDRLWLLEQTVVTVAPQHGQGGMQVTAGAAGHSRAERYLRFERSARIERDGQVMEAQDATVFLRADRDEPEVIELRRDARITGNGGTGALDAMQATDINLRYAADGRTLQQAVLAGAATIQLRRTDGQPGQHLRAESIDTSLAADGQVTQLVARDNVRVMLPPSGEAASRTITAATLNGRGEPGRGLTGMLFDGGTEYREDALKGRPARLARARTLDASLSSAETIDVAVFDGAFHFEDGQLTADSGHARYAITKGALELTSPRGGERPRVRAERASVDADRVDVTLSPRVLDAAGRVSVQLAPGGRDGARGSSLFSDKETIIATADAVTLDDGTQVGKYAGKALIFQNSGGTSIKADTITTDDKAGVLTATDNVVASLPFAGTADTKGKTSPAIARAAEFRFDDRARRALLTKQAQIDGAQGNVNAGRIELFLGASSNDLERLEAEENVTIGLDTRKATGQRLTYHTADEKYVLTGTPVRLTQGCQESTGRTLTFWKSSDRISVDGNDEVRGQTKSGKCE